MKNTLFKHPPREHSSGYVWFSRFLQIALAIITWFICFRMLEYSSGSSLEHVENMRIRYVLLNCLTIGVLWNIILIVSNRSWLASLLCTLVCGITAVINHYVLLYHGMPLSFLVLKNLKTAMNVVSAYQFTLDKIMFTLLCDMFLLFALCMAVRYFTKDSRPSRMLRHIRNIVLATASFLLIWFGYFGENPIKPQKTIAWLWTEAYHTYGYTACTIESIGQSINVVNQPDGYSTDAVNLIAIPEENRESYATPDVILILNESFYDLAQITDLKTDIPYLENIQTMDNVRTGYAVVPSNGGGTNNSEYELLTSNSLELMPGITPFNALDLYSANSIVSHMNTLGYSTLGAHSEPAVNYSRGQGYHALGFEKSFFEGSFADTEFYYNREWFETDACLYNNLIRWYEEAPADVPRFLYMLTIQNHGMWDSNDPQYDLVHTLGDYGDHTQSVNEFLTGIYLSDLAFKNLTDYFAQVDRPVIVCMVGDHCPSFAESIADPSFSEDEKQLRLRTVPLVFWANFPLEETAPGTISMNYVVPTLLDLAGINLSPYYSYQLQAKQTVPVISSYGCYYDAEGNIYRYSEDTGATYERTVDDYFYLEYNNLQTNTARNQTLFDP